MCQFLEVSIFGLFKSHTLILGSDGRYIDILSIQMIFYGIDTVSYRSSDIESNDIVTTPIYINIK